MGRDAVAHHPSQRPYHPYYPRFSRPQDQEPSRLPPDEPASLPPLLLCREQPLHEVTVLDAVATETEGVEAEDELRVVVRYGQEGVELTAPRPLTGQEVWLELNKTVFWGGFCGVPG